ncbi:MAG: hypothetical protein WBW31_07605 [Candidatus Sulfotelmatobacter sp.]
MLSNIRKRVKLTPSGVIAVMALVFATTGGAFAMNGGSGGSSPSRASASLTRASTPTATAAKSKAKSKSKSTAGARGPAGPAGKNGTNGTNGTNGAPGEKGAPGAQGLQGPQGPEGKEGKAGEPGKEGKAGANGTTGFTETLPPGKTETGTWGFFSVAEGFVVVPISFPIQLSAKLAETQVHYINQFNEEVIFPEPTQGLVFTGPTREEKKSTQCLGSVEAPTAEPGNLCVYGYSGSNEPFNFPFHNPENGMEEAGTTGTSLYFHEAGAEEGSNGTWAVTAPAEAK